MELIITDLADACKNKSQAEVTKDFVKAASYILSAAVGGNNMGGSIVKKKPYGAPLWDIKKFAPDQYFSQTSYYRVINIDGKKLTVENQYGNILYVSKDIIEKMDSGNHFAKEVPMTMTELADIL
jgi:hypothetical protein